MSEIQNKCQSNNKQIAKNTLFLYFRMFVMMGVSLFTSRVVLDVLGAEDYGLCNIINGVVVMFSFLNTALLSATQRFLNFNLGKGNLKQTNNVFCMSLNTYLILSAIILLIGETVGLWFINTHLNVPDGRMYAANWVYQFTLMQFIINLIRVPYNASIIAYEKMDFYAYISLAEVALKLAVVYLLYISTYDKLITYSFLYTLIPLFIAYLYMLYCKRQFQTTKYKLYWDKKTFKELFSFSSWTLFGALANVLAIQGLNIMINIFYGVTVNAAAGVATQVSNAVNGFITNFQTAFQPQIVKTYANGETKRFYNIIYTTSKFSFFLLFVIAFPIICGIDSILNLWLVDVPKYTADFSTLIFIFLSIDAFSAPLWMGVQAIGKIKTYQVLMTCIAYLSFPLGYIALKMGFAPYCIWIVRILVNVVMVLARCIFVQRKFGFPITAYLKQTVVPIFKVIIISTPIPLIIARLFPINNSVYGLLISFLAFFVIVPTIMFVGLNTNERILLKEMVGKKIPFINKRFK